jgi:hypothetical protein
MVIPSGVAFFIKSATILYKNYQKSGGFAPSIIEEAIKPILNQLGDHHEKYHRCNSIFIRSTWTILNCNGLACMEV